MNTNSCYVLWIDKCFILLLFLIDLNVIYVNTFISEFVPVRLACSSLVFLHCNFLCKEVSLLCSGQLFFFFFLNTQKYKPAAICLVLDNNFINTNVVISVD